MAADRQTLHEIMAALKSAIDTKALARKALEVYAEQEADDDFGPTDENVKLLASHIDQALFDANIHEKGTDEFTGALTCVVSEELGPFFS